MIGQKMGATWDIVYERKLVALLAAGFGLVFIDRYMILPLYPVLMKDLGLTYSDLGYITGALSLAWGASSIFMGHVSDRMGYRKVIIPALVIFSLIAGISGLATGLLSLVAIRATIGLAEGAYTPTSITAAIGASEPRRHGLNSGLQQLPGPLLGLGLAPIFVTQLLSYVSWHVVFSIVVIPGLIVAFLLWKILRDSPQSGAPQQPLEKHHWLEVFRYRNIRLNVLAELCWLACLTTLAMLLPNYLIDCMHLDIKQMGFIMSAIGLGGTLGALAISALSDIIGRRPTVVLSVLGTALFVWLLANAGPDPLLLFSYLGVIMFFLTGMIVMTIGVLCTESVPVGLASTASGLVIGVGEVFGGGISPVITGLIVQHFGISHFIYLCFIPLVVGLLVALNLKETAPERVHS